MNDKSIHKSVGALIDLRSDEIFFRIECFESYS